MEKSRIFISYKRDNKEVVFKIKDDIEKNVGEKCWVDFDGIESDAQFVNVIINAIDEADVFIFVYSKRHADITDFQNDWTIRELLYAGHKKKRIVFLNIDNTPLSDYFMLMFGTKLQVDVNSNNAMNQLYLDLRKWLGVKSDEIIVKKPETSNVVVAQKNKRGERIFISYKRKDKRTVFKIKDDIERHIGEKCWIDLNGIESDAYFVDVIMSAINRAEVFLFMYSKRHSDIIDTKKDWTVRELNFAEKKEKKIVFINLDNSKLTDYFEMMYGLKQQVYVDSKDAMNNLYVDLSKWLKIDGFPNVVSDNKKCNLDKIKKLWSNFRIFFRFRFLFIFLICFLSGYTFFKGFGFDKNVGHDYVDLGLSVKWATCNVGANTPEEYGDYFAWGEIAPKKSYNWNTYTHCSGLFNKQIKYCTNSKFGVVDNDTILNFEDDIAAINWGERWRMPTVEEMSELREKCDWLWTTRGGVNGYLVTSKVEGYTDCSIFLPAAGCMTEDTLSLVGVYGRYWSSSLHNGRPYYAYILSFNSSVVDDSVYISRRYGRSVRPVYP